MSSFPRPPRTLKPKTPKQWLSLLVFLASVAIIIGQQFGWLDGLTDLAAENQPGFYTVTKYDDGDTIQIDMNGTTETLRFVGIDSPETHDPRKKVQCYGQQASDFTKRTISQAGGKVRLEADRLSTNRDRYDRLLRYIYLPDGRLLQAELLRGGYAFYYPYFQFTKSADFASLQASAQTTKAGLWGTCRPLQTDNGGYTSNDL